MSDNATAPTLPPIASKLMLETLVDDLDELGRLAWNGEDQDRLRVLADESMMIAATLLEHAPAQA